MVCESKTVLVATVALPVRSTVGSSVLGGEMETLNEEFWASAMAPREALLARGDEGVLKYSEFFFGLGGFKRILEIVDVPSKAIFCNDFDKQIKQFHKDVSATKWHTVEVNDDIDDAWTKYKAWQGPATVSRM